MIIGICGGTGSGKTTVANRILASVSAGEVVFLQQDSYYRNLEDLPHDFRQAVNFDHPDAVDNELLLEHVRALREGRAVDLPLYDFKTHTRMAETLRVEPKPIIIIEGILIFVDPRLMAQPLHPIFVDLVANAAAPRMPANLRLDETATATHQAMGPVWLGERPADDAFFAELNTAVQAVMDRPIP